MLRFRIPSNVLEPDPDQIQGHGPDHLKNIRELELLWSIFKVFNDLNITESWIQIPILIKLKVESGSMLR